ncbi:MAG: iron-containing alcohol dehydrogenase family protein [Oscillospiraceae bacterium]|jgi:glycerol dehydrogenase|nr:iron-containing alcohol dehydrogenase family protein [Oscillospiraceae bacterium]
MTTFALPKRYISEPGAVFRAGEAVGEIARRVLIIGGKTALGAVGDELTDSLGAHGVQYEAAVHGGYPSLRAAREFSARAAGYGAMAIVGVGGGRVLDTAKAAGHFAGLPVIAVPTIAATCAAWAPTSIMYSDEGEFTEFLPYDEAPVLVVADTDVIARAPVRYIRSGASDALARWYENRTNLARSNGFYLRWTLKQAELIREILRGEGLAAIDGLSRGQYDPARAREVIDANILLTGFFVSPRNTEEPFTGGFAHPLYHTFSILHDLHGTLHGEQIAFFLIASGIIENVPDDELNERLSIFSALRQPLTLDAIGLKDGVDEKLHTGIRAFLSASAAYGRRAVDISEDQIYGAIIKADGLGRRFS